MESGCQPVREPQSLWTRGVSVLRVMERNCKLESDWKLFKGRRAAHVQASLGEPVLPDPPRTPRSPHSLANPSAACSLRLSCLALCTISPSSEPPPPAASASLAFRTLL